MTLLSIIIPTFNCSSVIKRCIDSVLGQSFTDFEVLIMDGQSTDGTLDIAHSYNDSRIVVYSEPDNGIYDAMNKGILKSNGEWLYFLGSDDWLLNNDVLSRVFVKENMNYDILYGDVESERLSPSYLGEWKIDTIFYNRCHQGLFYKKSVLIDLGLYDLKYKALADFDLNLKWFFSPGITPRYLPINVAHYSDGGFSSSITDDAFENDVHLKILKLGRKQLSLEQKRFHAKHASYSHERSLPLRLVLKLYYIVLTPFCYLQRIISKKK